MPYIIHYIKLKNSFQINSKIEVISKLFSANTEYCSGVLYADRAMLKQQLFERSEFCCLIAIAKYNSHAEISVFAEE